MTEPARRARIRWRCRRGLLELDLILLGFFDRYYTGLTSAEQGAFEELLSVPDNTLLAYLNRAESPAEMELKTIVKTIIQITDN